MIRSTVQPGTVEDKIEPILERASGKKAGVDFGVCFQPEFLREGSSIRDYDHPPYTIVGGNCEAAVEQVRDVFQHLDARFLVTNIRVAETLKMAATPSTRSRSPSPTRSAASRSRWASIRTKSCAWCAPTSV